MRAFVREYRPQDLAQLLKLWERGDAIQIGREWLTVDQAVDLLNARETVALVAEVDSELAAAALAGVSVVVGWVYRLSLLAVPEEDLLGQLLEQLGRRLAQAGARKLALLVGEDKQLEGLLAGRGYRLTDGLRYLERELALPAPEATALAEAGGRMISQGLWDELKGMDEAKEIIERRVILPLAEPELAARHGVVSPRAIVLFGPPGTGKTTFAKGIASRLGWPFVEIQPSELADEGPERQARLLAEAFERVLALDAAVVFVDEVEDLASIRHAERRVSPSVTNEFLKQIPHLREAPQHLLACATNAVDQLDPAFLRPGRFDYILPAGPPNPQAREAIWGRYVSEITDASVAIDELVMQSELFTPADIEFAARKAAQNAFERDYLEQTGQRATTADFLAAIKATKPTLTAEIVAGFEEQTGRYARY